ncbi:MAG: Hsp20/alpha crystallin family protein [Thermodesulfobacteriota bacterium]
MLDLMKYDPFSASFPLRSLSRWFEGPSLFRHFFDEGERLVLPKVDVVEGETEYKITAEVPGYAREDLKVEVDNGVLRLSAEKKEEKEEKKENYHLRERRYGSFARSFNLPENVDGGKIEAKVKDGVLTVIVPKAEPSRPKQIEVKVH